MTDLTPDILRQRIQHAFSHLYPGAEAIEVDLNDDETIVVSVLDTNNSYPTFKADIDSDDDDYLRFGLYDPDYEEEHPDEDRTDYLMVRVCITVEVGQ